jgi:hypothetical protein
MRKKLLLLALSMLWALPVFSQQVYTAWARKYNGPGNSDDRATALAVDRSGNVYVTGYSYGSGTNYDYATIKYYPNGDTAWVRRYNGPGNLDDGANALAVDDSGNVYVTGHSWGSGTGPDYATIKYYPNGDTAWVRRYNGLGNADDEANAIAVDGSGNVCVTGFDMSVGSGTNYDYATIKYDPNGKQLWLKTYNGPGNADDVPTAIAVDGSGNIYVTGWSPDSGTYYYDDVTIKYYPNGDTAWLRRHNGPGNSDNAAKAIAVDPSGNVYVTGFNYTTIKYDSAGNQLWVQGYIAPGQAGAVANAVAVDGSGNVYVTGWSDSYVTSFDYATIKYDSAGNQLWVQRYCGIGTFADDEPSAIAVDGPGNVYVTGWSLGSGTSDDYATIKYFPFICGDANGDGKVTISDVVYLINYLFKGGPPPIPLKAGDANSDGKETVSDVIYTVNYLFKGGLQPCQNCP